MRLDLLVNDFVYRAVNDRAVVLFEAHFKRNYIHVRDVAARLPACPRATSTPCSGQAYNVGLSDANLSKLELCERIKRARAGVRRIWRRHRRGPGQARLHRVERQDRGAPGSSPKDSLDDGIQELIKGYRMIPRTLYGNV